MFLDLAKQRRSVYQFLDKSVEDEKIDTCLEAATWAPNHKLTEPWRFYVLGEKTKNEFESLYGKLRADSRTIPDTREHEMIYQKGKQKFAKIPKVIFVGQVKSTNLTLYKEDYAACACAIQNFQLMAWELGLGVQWSTGPLISNQLTFQKLGISSHEIELIGLLYVGYPSPDCLPTAKRTAASALTNFYP